MLQKTLGLRRDVRYVAPILRQWSTGRRGVGFTRPCQRVGERFHTLPWSKRGELQDRVEGVICGGSERGGNSIVCSVDGGVDSGVGIDNESHRA